MCAGRERATAFHVEVTVIGKSSEDLQQKIGVLCNHLRKAWVLGAKLLYEGLKECWILLDCFTKLGKLGRICQRAEVGHTGSAQGISAGALLLLLLLLLLGELEDKGLVSQADAPYHVIVYLEEILWNIGGRGGWRGSGCSGCRGRCGGVGSRSSWLGGRGATSGGLL